MRRGFPQAWKLSQGGEEKADFMGGIGFCAVCSRTTLGAIECPTCGI